MTSTAASNDQGFDASAGVGIGGSVATAGDMRSSEVGQNNDQANSVQLPEQVNLGQGPAFLASKPTWQAYNLTVDGFGNNLGPICHAQTGPSPSSVSSTALAGQHTAPQLDVTGFLDPPLPPIATTSTFGSALPLLGHETSHAPVTCASDNPGKCPLIEQA
jgi:hypothetical protein